jgi:hypothetical protein
MTWEGSAFRGAEDIVNKLAVRITFLEIISSDTDSVA